MVEIPQVPSCSEIIDALTDEDRAQLTYFAEKRHEFFFKTKANAEDAVQQAQVAILHGGRHPRPADLASKDAFLNYMRGVINSLIEGWARPFKDNPHESLDEMEYNLAAPPTAQVEFNDFKAQLFTRLRQRAPSRLIPTIDAWEQSPEGRIPRVTCRKHVAAVRKLAQAVATELGYA